MDQKLKKSIDELWLKKLDKLKEEVAGAFRKVDEILIVEENNRSGHEEKNLEKSMGSFGSGSLDFGAISKAVKKVDKAGSMDDTRFERIKTLKEELESLSEKLEKEPPMPKYLSVEKGLDDILFDVEAHFDAMAEIFRLIRTADMEAGARYDLEIHDAFFKKFDWRYLEDSEMKISPSVVVFLDIHEHSDLYFEKVMPLLSSGRPVKMITSQKTFGKRINLTGREMALKNAFRMDMLPIALKGIHLFQAPHGSAHFSEKLEVAINSPKSALISAFVSENKDDAELAVNSRTFPTFVYSPEKSEDFLMRFDLDLNPNIEKTYTTKILEYKTPTGEMEKVEKAYTFADFVYEKNYVEDEFADFPEDKVGMELIDYIQVAQIDRINKIPFIYVLTEEKKLVKKVPSKALVTETSERLKSWNNLRELSGINNPHVLERERELKEELEKEKAEALAKLEAEFEEKAKAREKSAVDSAMANLAKKLAGMADIKAVVPAAAPKKSERKTDESAVVEEAPAPAETETSDEPWIETESCTACDECVTINNKIFVYNDDNQAIIKDAKAGPFKDIVKAAEKCSVSIIHPGKPLDPNEKDLEKWIKKAEPFQ
jgi:pyruvate-ferredoxin/flavodoxin oxidoreductase